MGKTVAPPPRRDDPHCGFDPTQDMFPHTVGDKVTVLLIAIAIALVTVWEWFRL